MSSDNNSVFLMGGLAALAIWFFGSSSSQQKPTVPVAQSQTAPAPNAPTSKPPASAPQKTDEKSPEGPVEVGSSAGPKEL